MSFNYQLEVVGDKSDPYYMWCPRSREIGSFLKVQSWEL